MRFKCKVDSIKIFVVLPYFLQIISRILFISGILLLK